MIRVTLTMRLSVLEQCVRQGCQFVIIKLSRAVSALIAATIFFLTGCASGTACKDGCAVLSPAGTLSSADRDIIEAFNARCASDVVLKELDGKWVPWRTGGTSWNSKMSDDYQLSVNTGVHTLLFSANFDTVGPLRPSPPASHRGTPRSLKVELEGGKRYYFCATLPENAPPEGWEPAMFWVADIQP